MNIESFNRIIRECNKIIDDPYNRIARQKNEGSIYFGYNCIFTPEEIIHAAGFTPIRLFADYKEDIFSEKYMHNQTCEFARNFLETFRKGYFNFLEGCVLINCCDTLHTVFAILEVLWKKNIYYINIPFKKEDKNSREFLTYELDKFKSYLEKYYKLQIKSQDLKESISVYKENRKKLCQLAQFLKNGTISGTDFFAVQKAGYFIRKERHNEMLSTLIKILGQTDRIKRNGVKIFVSGFVNGRTELLKYIENLGASIVADDLCGFSRYWYKNNSNTSYKNPLQEICFNCLIKYCPLKVTNDDYYYDIFKKKYEGSGAKGIIFFIYPFCDPQSIEYTSFKYKLNEAGIKTLFLQSSINFKHLAQIETRVEAFLEMLRQG